MELRHLRYFCVVADELNLTRAAEKLFIAQPPLTRQIKQLEEEIGVALFVREARGLSLTPAGEYFLKQAVCILEKVDNSVEETRNVADHGRVVFSIGFVPSVFYGQLPSLVRRLRQLSNIEVVLHELKTAEQVEALKTGKIDIGFGRIRVPDLGSDVEQTVLFQEPIVVALPASHPLAKQPVKMEDLAKLPIILFPSGQGPNFADICLGLFARRALDIKVTQQVNDLQTALGLVASEMGFSLVPEQVRRLNRDDVAFVRLEDKSITTPVVCSRRKEENSETMEFALSILDELVQNRLTGRYP
ncbi:MAG: LysR family transcriptional regulator [Alteromonas sp.]|nr:LysR family transcriptional regulator [Alteromonas sp.]